MDNFESTPKPERSGEIIDLCPGVKSFQTELGSVYEKLPDGTFRRHKYDGTEHEPMEWTLFTDEEGQREFQRTKDLLQWPRRTDVIFFVIAAFNEAGDCIKQISHRGEIVGIDAYDFDLLTYRNDRKGGESEILYQTPITFTPKVGYQVFEFSNGGQEHHYGDVVSKIETLE